jgi:hypothetical protein
MLAIVALGFQVSYGLCVPPPRPLIEGYIMKNLRLTVFASFCYVVMLASCSVNKGEDLNLSKLDTLTIPESMKGWELYSWPEGDKWKYSFLMGTNATKSLPQVKNSGWALVKVTGADSVKMVLNKFPKGETISLIGQGWLQRSWGGQDIGNLQLPPAAVVNDLTLYSTSKGLTFQVVD